MGDGNDSGGVCTPDNGAVCLPDGSTETPAPQIDEAGALAPERASAMQTQDYGNDISTKISAKAFGGGAYWFAALYDTISKFELRAVDNKEFDHPAFLCHFIPIFYNMYARNAELFLKDDMDHMDVWWQLHFYPDAAISGNVSVTATALLKDNTLINEDMKQSILRLSAIIDIMVEGVRAHIQQDMKVALARAYSTYAQTYKNVPAFDDHHHDFFEINRAVFERVTTSIIADLLASEFIPVNAEAAKTLAQLFHVGLDTDQIYTWRQAAWDSAKNALAQNNGP